MSYTYATAQQTDASTNETFWSDFDRRHAVNAVGVFRAGRQTTLGVIVRSASGAPIPGYFALNDGKLGVGNHRNVVRLPAYVRVDARAQRSFFSSRHALTVFGEVLNVFNRANQGLAGGTIQPLTGEAIGITRPLLPRKISVGVEISLGR
jgi:hypothetical protein